MTEDRDWMSAAEVAELLDWTKKTIYNRIQAGTAPPHYRLMGGPYRFDRAEVLAWVEGQKRDGQPAQAKGQGDG